MATAPADPAYPSATTPRLHLRRMALADARDIWEIRSDWEMAKWATGPYEPHLAQTEAWIRQKILGNPAEVLNFSIELLQQHGGDGDGEGGQPRRNKVIGAVGAVRGPEVGYMIATAHCGKGFASEALRAFLDLYWAAVPRPRAGNSDGAGGQEAPAGNVAEASPVVTGAAPDTRDVMAGVDISSAGAPGDAAKEGEPSALALSRGWDYIEGIVDPENKGSARVLVKCGFRLWSTTKDDYESVNLGTRSTAIYRLARPGTELGQPPGPFEIDMGPGLT